LIEPGVFADSALSATPGVGSLGKSSLASSLQIFQRTSKGRHSIDQSGLSHYGCFASIYHLRDSSRRHRSVLSIRTTWKLAPFRVRYSRHLSEPALSAPLQNVIRFLQDLLPATHCVVLANDLLTIMFPEQSVTGLPRSIDATFTNPLGGRSSPGCETSSEGGISRSTSQQP
jgi:hypothetical protein